MRHSMSASVIRKKPRLANRRTSRSRVLSTPESWSRCRSLQKLWRSQALLCKSEELGLHHALHDLLTSRHSSLDSPKKPEAQPRHSPPPAPHCPLQAPRGHIQHGRVLPVKASKAEAPEVAAVAARGSSFRLVCTCTVLNRSITGF